MVTPETLAAEPVTQIEAPAETPPASAEAAAAPAAESPVQPEAPAATKGSPT